MGDRNSNDVFQRRESRVRSYARQFPALFDRAVGSELFDEDGRRYIDFFAGAGSINYGHAHPAMKSAMIDYLSRDSILHSLDLRTVAKARFLDVLERHILLPRGLDHVVQFTGPTGANAVEAAIKLARKATGRTNIIAFTNGFHGVSAGALSVTGNRFQRAGYGRPLDGTSVMPFDGYLGDRIDTLDYLERVLDDPSGGVDTPAAVIVEAVQGEGGLNVASPLWLRRLADICRERGILTILDEVQIGCGRSGDFFGFEESGIVPDLVPLSKSLSGAGLPLSVVLIRRDIDQWKPGEHNGTFRGNNLAFVTATVAIELFWPDRAFADATRAKGERVANRLEAMRADRPDAFTMVKGRGMMRGLACADPDVAAAIGRAAFERGLVIERAGPHDEVIKCLMPLTTPDALIDEGLDILEAAADAVLGMASATARRPSLESVG